MTSVTHKRVPVFDQDQNQCHWPAAPKIVAHCSAIACSSFAGMIRTATLAPGEAMLKAPALLASASQVMPSQARRAQMRARLSGWCSPIPPVNTQASIPQILKESADMGRAACKERG